MKRILGDLKKESREDCQNQQGIFGSSINPSVIFSRERERD